MSMPPELATNSHVASHQHGPCLSIQRAKHMRRLVVLEISQFILRNRPISVNDSQVCPPDVQNMACFVLMQVSPVSFPTFHMRTEIQYMYLEPRRKSRSSFLRNWPNIYIRPRIPIPHINLYLTCDVCTLFGLVSRFYCMSFTTLILYLLIFVLFSTAIAECF